jgi:hypothetical protein
MPKKIYTKKQIEELKKHPYIDNCAGTYITFSNSIKYESVYY